MATVVVDDGQEAEGGRWVYRNEALAICKKFTKRTEQFGL